MIADPTKPMAPVTLIFITNLQYATDLLQVYCSQFHSGARLR